MKKKTTTAIHFGFQCDQDWNNMKPDDQGRHCASCKKNVIDFSLMSSASAVHYLKTNKSVCGKMSSTQLEEVNAYVGLQNSAQFSLKSIITGAALSLTSLVYGQKEPTVLFENERLKVIELANGINPDSLIDNKMTAVVTDDTGEPIPFIRVHLPEANQGMYTNFDGEFKVQYDAEIPGKIHLRTQGFMEDSSLVAHDFINKKIQIMMKPSMFAQEIEIVGALVTTFHPIQRVGTKVRAFVRFGRNRME